jgi:hypothetical protein
MKEAMDQDKDEAIPFSCSVFLDQSILEVYCTLRAKDNV